MPKSAHVQVIGEQRLRANLVTFTEGVDPVTTRELEAVADKIRDHAKAIAAIDTGAMMKSVAKEKIVVKGLVKSIRVRAGGRVVNPKTGRLVDYASYVEFGTSRNRPQPFLRPAYVKHRTDVIKAIMGGMIARMK